MIFGHNQRMRRDSEVTGERGAEVERRRVLRYPVDLGGQYTVIVGTEFTVGHGRTLNISDGGVLLQSERAMPVGAKIELSIPWPTRLQKPLRLWATGQTVRIQDKLAAVRIAEYEFRPVDAEFLAHSMA